MAVRALRIPSADDRLPIKVDVPSYPLPFRTEQDNIEPLHNMRLHARGDEILAMGLHNRGPLRLR